MRVTIKGNLIRICGANSGYLLSLTLFMLPLAALLIYGGALFVMYEPFTVATPFIWIIMVCATILIIFMPRACWQALKACTTIDRNLRMVTVQKGNETKNYSLGMFEKILMQPARVPRVGFQYHAYLVGTSGKCHLEIVAGSKNQLYSKLQPVSRLLSIPIDEDPNIATFDTILNR